MKKPIIVLSILSSVFAMSSAFLGTLYSFGGVQRTVENIYGQQVVLFGDGIYKNDSLLKAGASKGTDVCVIIAALLLIFTVVFLKRKRFAPFLQCGLLSTLLYTSACLVFGISYNRLFLLYVLQFGSVLITFVLSMAALLKARSFSSALYETRLIGTGIFMMLVFCFTSALWLTFTIPPTISDTPMGLIDIYTTEPTFVLDLAVVLPLCLFCGIMLLRKKAIAYQLTPVLLILLTGVGVSVILQVVFQTYMGIEIAPAQLFGMVISFVILGAAAMILNLKWMNRLNKGVVSHGV